MFDDEVPPDAPAGTLSLTRTAQAFLSKIDRAALDAALSEGVAELGRLDIVVANAGMSTMSMAGTGSMSQEMWSEMLDVNLTSVWNTTSAATPHLRAAGGGSMVLIISAVAGPKAYANIGHYVAAKHGVQGLMRVLAVELGPESIRVNGILPTQVNTPMIQISSRGLRYDPYISPRSMCR